MNKHGWIMCNCVLCHLLHVDPSLVVVLSKLCCMLCVQLTWATTMLICGLWIKSWHMGCLMLSLEKILIGK